MSARQWAKNYKKTPEPRHLVYKTLLNNIWTDTILSLDFRYVVDNMPLKMKHCMMLKIEGYEMKEIARLMKMTIPAVYNQLSKAKKRIMTTVF